MDSEKPFMEKKIMFCLDSFIANYVVKRSVSMFKKDIDNNFDIRSQKI